MIENPNKSLTWEAGKKKVYLCLFLRNLLIGARKKRQKTVDPEDQKISKASQHTSHYSLASIK